MGLEHDVHFRLLAHTREPEVLLEAKASEVEEILFRFRNKHDLDLFVIEREEHLPIAENLGPAMHHITRRLETRFQTNRGEILVSATKEGDPFFERGEGEELIASLRLTLPGKQEIHFGTEWREKFWAWLLSTPPYYAKH